MVEIIVFVIFCSIENLDSAINLHIANRQTRATPHLQQHNPKASYNGSVGRLLHIFYEKELGRMRTHLHHSTPARWDVECPPGIKRMQPNGIP